MQKVRKNRLKKKSVRQPGEGSRRIVVGLKLTGLILLVLVVSALFMTAYATVTHSDYFRTRSIEVVGNQWVSTQQILTQAGLQPGDNLMALNLRIIRERLLAHPWISSARVSRDIPETISIQVVEQIPLAVLDLGRKFLINTQGRIFKEYTESDPDDLPTITGFSYGDISLGDDALSVPMSTVLEVLLISQTTQGAVPFGDIVCLDLDKEIGVTLTTERSEQQIKLGFGNLKEKNQRLKQLLPYLEGNTQWRGFRVLDANNPNRIVVQLGPTPQAGGKDA